nr:hypothetical protein [Gemmatimonadota bacterium]
KNDAAKDATLIDLVRQQKGDGVTIVYASTRRTVERIAQMLKRAKIPTVGYHAGLDDATRADVQDAFMTERAKVIVATNAFGMGIDKPNVRLVVHYAMPGTLEAYYQEAGRGGRDRAPATAILLHAYPDRFTHEFFIDSAIPGRAVVTAVYTACRKLAEADGLVSEDAAGIAATATSKQTKVSDRQVQSSLQILGKAGALAVADPSRTHASVRLLATPERIKAELIRESSRISMWCRRESAGRLGPSRSSRRCNRARWWSGDVSARGSRWRIPRRRSTPGGSTGPRSSGGTSPR